MRGEAGGTHLGVVRVHDGLGRRADGDGHLEVRLAAAGAQKEGEGSARRSSRAAQKGAERETTKREKDARLGDPGNLGREALDVVLFPLEDGLGHKHGEVGVVDAESLDVTVEPGCERRSERGQEALERGRLQVSSEQEGREGRTLNLLPDAVRPGLEDVAARDVVVVEHLALDEDLLVPVAEDGLLLLDRDAELDAGLALDVGLTRLGRGGGRGRGRTGGGGGLGGRLGALEEELGLLKGGALLLELKDGLVPVVVRENEGLGRVPGRGDGEGGRRRERRRGDEEGRGGERRRERERRGCVREGLCISVAVASCCSRLLVVVVGLVEREGAGLVRARRARLGLALAAHPERAHAQEGEGRRD